jgi:hypothetical protein
MTQGVPPFIKQAELHQDPPPQVRKPNKTTRAALEDARARRSLETFSSIQELVEDLEI